MGMRLRACDPVRRVFPRILKADLDVIESGVDESFEPLLVEPNAGSNQIGIETCSARSSDQFGQVGACERFAAREMRMQHSQFSRLLEDTCPLIGR